MQCVPEKVSTKNISQKANNPAVCKHDFGVASRITFSFSHDLYSAHSSMIKFIYEYNGIKVHINELTSVTQSYESRHTYMYTVQYTHTHTCGHQAIAV